MTTLAELRLANLREQKKSAEDTAEDAAAAADALLAAADALLAVADPVPAAVHSRLPPDALEPPAREDDLILSSYLPDAASEVAPASEAERSAALIARVHDLLAHKTLHPNGAKATVDMSPALFHRAKRYCLDHGNVTLRQLFLDLMTAFLDEEDY